MSYRGGVLTVRPQLTVVCFGAVTWFKTHREVAEIRKFWHKQGYFEAEEIPYQVTNDGLIVERNLEEFGWAVAGDINEDIYDLPF